MRVVISPLQISFLIPVTAIPGTLGILFTLFLCTITISILSQRAPQNLVGAIIQWILACHFFIAMAILEYALILGYKKYRKVKKTGNESCMKKGKRARRVDWKNTQILSQWLDKLMLIIFLQRFSYSPSYSGILGKWTNTISALLYLTGCSNR